MSGGRPQRVATLIVLAGLLAFAALHAPVPQSGPHRRDAMKEG
jgi:hypothetical protein